MGPGAPIALRWPIQASAPVALTAIAEAVTKDSAARSGVVAGADEIVAPLRRSIRLTLEASVSTPLSIVSVAA